MNEFTFNIFTPCGSEADNTVILTMEKKNNGPAITGVFMHTLKGI